MMIKPEERDEEIVTFVDNGFSGGNIDRDGFCRMMKQVEEELAAADAREAAAAAEEGNHADE